MKNKQILSLFFYNVSSILKKLSLGTTIMIVYFSFLIDTILSEIDDIKARNALLYFVENPWELIFRSYLSMFVAMMIVIICIMIFNYSKPLEYKEEKIENLITKIRADYNLSSWITIKLSREPRTFLNRLYVPLNALTNTNDTDVLFLLFHEKAHLISYDSFLSLFEKSLSIICALILSLFLMAKFSDFFVAYIDMPNWVYLVITVASFIVVFYVMNYMQFTETRFKEHICDLYAKSNLNFPKWNLDLGYSKTTISHPSAVSRENLINGSLSYYYWVKIICYEVSYIIAFVYLTSFDLYFFYKYILIFIMLFHFLSLFWMIKCVT